MNCKNCGHEIDKKAVVCTNCGRKIKKPFFKKWWFWVIIALAVICAAASNSGKDTESDNTDSVVTESKDSATENTQTATEATEEIEYIAVDLQTMFDDLDNNAMKAEHNYQNKYVEFECKIKSFDSDGQYISVEPVNASEWNFTTAMCYIKNTEQKEFLIEKNVGDIITIKGKVKSIGEILGYTVDIKEVH